MRKILFRGKSLFNRQWVLGSLVKAENICAIVPEGAAYCGGGEFDDAYGVDPSTVGQFTGLTDADGRPIFEGDMFEPDDDEFDKSVVEFRDGAFRVITYGVTGMMMPFGWDETAGGYGELDEHDLIDWVDCSVIGNIHDNPRNDGGVSMDNLKPCPFCGRNGYIALSMSAQNELVCVVKCENIRCVMSGGGTLSQTEEQAINAWNRRVRDDEH